jgi:hypothetical protein
MSLALVGVTSYLVIRKLRNRQRIEPEETADRSNNDIEVHKDLDLVRSLDNELVEKDLTENRSNLKIVDI